MSLQVFGKTEKRGFLDVSVQEINKKFYRAVEKAKIIGKGLIFAEKNWGMKAKILEEGFWNEILSDGRDSPYFLDSEKSLIVKYLDLEEREKFKVNFQYDPISKTTKLKLNGEYINSNQELMYVIDVYQNVFVNFEVTEESDNEITIFHHSSFLRGAPVICAGKLKINNGELTFISNNSGHYFPKIYELFNALVVLKNKGIKLNEVKLDFLCEIKRKRKTSSFIQKALPASFIDLIIKKFSSAEKFMEKVELKKQKRQLVCFN